MVKHVTHWSLFLVKRSVSHHKNQYQKGQVAVVLETHHISGLQVSLLPRPTRQRMRNKKTNYWMYKMIDGWLYNMSVMKLCWILKLLMGNTWWSDLFFKPTLSTRKRPPKITTLTEWIVANIIPSPDHKYINRFSHTNHGLWD